MKYWDSEDLFKSYVLYKSLDTYNKQARTLLINN